MVLERPDGQADSKHGRRVGRLLVALVVLTTVVGAVAPVIGTVGATTAVAGTVEQTSGDAYEPNDVRSEAAPVTPSTYTDLSVGDGDEDYYAINASAGDEISASIDFSHAQADLDLAILGPDGDQIGTSTSISDGESVSVTAEQSGTYYIHVYSYDGNTAGYDMAVDRTAGTYSGSDQFDPNEGQSSASPVSVGSYTDLSAGGGDTDYYAVDASAGDEISASIDFSHAQADLDLEILGPGGYAVDGSASVSDGESVSVTTDQSGTYYIHVYSYDGNTAGYDMTIDQQQGTATGSDQFDPNEGQSSAAAISGGSYTGLSVGSGDTDYYAIDASAGDELSASIDFSHAQADLDLELIGPGGDEIDDSVSTNDGESVSVTADQSGTYYVHVYSYDGNSADYDMSVSRTAGTSSGSDQFDPNEGQSSASPVSVGSYTGLSVGDGDTDYYSVDLASGDEVSASIDFSHTQADLDLSLIGPGGDMLDSSNSISDGESVSTTASQSGTYYVHVYSYNGNAADYDMTIGADSSSDSSEPSGTADLDISVTTNQPAPGETLDIEYAVTNEGSETTAIILKSGTSSLVNAWDVSDRSDAGGTWQSADAEWLFQQVAPGETVQPSISVEVPDEDDLAGESGQFSVTAQTDSGTVEQSFEVRIAESQSAVAAIDANGNGELDDSEILAAIDAWQNNQAVAGGQTLTDSQILELIDMWQNNENI